MHTPQTQTKAKRGESEYRWGKKKGECGWGEEEGKMPMLELIWHSNIQVSWDIGKTNG